MNKKRGGCLCLYYVYITNGFEELEAVGTIALFRRAGIQIDVCAISDTKASGRFELTFSDIKNLDDVDYKSYDALFFPGGPHYQKLEQNEYVMSYFKIFYGKQ